MYLNCSQKYAVTVTSINGTISVGFTRLCHWGRVLYLKKQMSCLVAGACEDVTKWQSAVFKFLRICCSNGAKQLRTHFMYKWVPSAFRHLLAVYIPSIKDVARFLRNDSCLSWPTDRMGFWYKSKDFRWNCNSTPSYIVPVQKFVVILWRHETRMFVIFFAKYCEFTFFYNLNPARILNPDCWKVMNSGGEGREFLWKIGTFL